MKKISLIIVGFGVIGAGFARILHEKKDYLRDLGLEYKVVAVCEKEGSIISDEGIDLGDVLRLADGKKLAQHSGWTKKKSMQVLDEVKADIVLELTPGDVKRGEPGYGHIKKALSGGMHVVTSNKSPIALHYGELKRLAEENNLKLRYEAAVGGAIPLLNLRDKCLKINEIKSVYGILNGTTNYVLSKMVEEGISLENALDEARELGIAESDPSYDIDGLDTALKVVILANNLLGRDVSFEDIRVQGIRDITSEAVQLAIKHGYVIKLIGDVGRGEVSPRLIPVEHPLNVSGSLNAVLLDSDVAGELTLIGYGAGARQTASSIFSDLTEVTQFV
ncbi:MAG: homoserine dehydrogenase [Candidatus Altiarchaeales archaeon ex4484_96]|nr:MAG: homoserine dehydrogenase [Candidatus Altiarchaeales archaeon ex4484_96]